MAKDILQLSEHDRFIMCVPVFHGSHQVNDFDHGLTEDATVFCIHIRGLCLGVQQLLLHRDRQTARIRFAVVRSTWKARSDVGRRRV